MSTFSELADALERVAAAAVSAGRAADSVDPVECDHLLSTILKVDRKLSTATAYLRRRARPGGISGYGESHDRMRESLDGLAIQVDRWRHDDDEAEEDDDISADAESARSSSVLAWDEFVAEHPELKPEPLKFTDDELIAALAEAERQWGESRSRKRTPHRKHRVHRGAWANCAAAILSGGNACGERMVAPTPGDVIRVGRALARLGREGRIFLTSRPHESKRWSVNATGGDDA